MSFNCGRNGAHLGKSRRRGPIPLAVAIFFAEPEPDKRFCTPFLQISFVNGHSDPSSVPDCQSRNSRTTSVLFWPPKPKLFDRATRTSVFRDLFGT